MLKGHAAAWAAGLGLGLTLIATAPLIAERPPGKHPGQCDLYAGPTPGPPGVSSWLRLDVDTSGALGAFIWGSGTAVLSQDSSVNPKAKAITLRYFVDNEPLPSKAAVTIEASADPGFAKIAIAKTLTPSPATCTIEAGAALDLPMSQDQPDRVDGLPDQLKLPHKAKTGPGTTWYLRAKSVSDHPAYSNKVTVTVYKWPK